MYIIFVNSKSIILIGLKLYEELIKTISYVCFKQYTDHTGRAKRIWYLSPMRAAKVQASLRIRAVSPEPSLLAHTSSESRGTFRQKARSLAPLNGWACAVKICNDGMLEDTNSLDGAQLFWILSVLKCSIIFSQNHDLLFVAMTTHFRTFMPL